MNCSWKRILLVLYCYWVAQSCSSFWTASCELRDCCSIPWGMSNGICKILSPPQLCEVIYVNWRVMNFSSSQGFQMCDRLRLKQHVLTTWVGCMRGRYKDDRENRIVVLAIWPPPFRCVYCDFNNLWNIVSGMWGKTLHSQLSSIGYICNPVLADFEANPIELVRANILVNVHMIRLWIQQYIWDNLPFSAFSCEQLKNGERERDVRFTILSPFYFPLWSNVLIRLSSCTIFFKNWIFLDPLKTILPAYYASYSCTALGGPVVRYVPRGRRATTTSL